MPFVGYAFRWAVVEGGRTVDLALTKRAALRRRPLSPGVWSTVRPIERAS